MDIISMAQDADAATNFPIAEIPMDRIVPFLENFAAIIAAAEREECAKVCDELAKFWTENGNDAESCAIAIRARGQS